MRIFRMNYRQLPNPPIGAINDIRASSRPHKQIEAVLKIMLLYSYSSKYTTHLPILSCRILTWFAEDSF